MKSFSKHLFSSLIPGFVVTLLVSGLIIKLLISRDLAEEFDLTLESRTEALMGITEQDEDGVELEVYASALPNYFSENNPDYFFIRDQTGQKLFGSHTLGGLELPQYQPTEKEIYFSNIKLPDGRAGRIVYRNYFPKIDIDDDDSVSSNRTTRPLQAFASPGTHVIINGIEIIPEKVTMALAISRQTLDEKISRLNIILLLTGLLTISVVVLLQKLAISRAVKPILKMNDQIQNRDLNNLHHPVTLSRPIQELDELKNRFNELMARVSDGLARERRFTANLAHEIRTPIAELKALVDVKQRWPDDPDLRDNFETDMQSVVERMERLVENMLALGRGSLGQIQKVGKVDLAHELAHLIKLYSAEIQKKQLDIRTYYPSTPLVLLGVDHWILIITNLLDNAVQYSPNNAKIEVILDNDLLEQRFQLTIANSQTDLTDEDLDRIFQPMWRKDESRTSARNSGLGLALVKTYVEALDCAIDIKLTPDNLFTVAIVGDLPTPGINK